MLLRSLKLWGVLFLVVSGLLGVSDKLSASTMVPPDEYGRVVIRNYSGRAGLAPVVFNHWLHRARFTCRLCHVDIGFAMEAGGTKIKAASNEKGYYCGSCHKGNFVFEDKKVFTACSTRPEDAKDQRCDRCHSLDKKVKKEYEFLTFTEHLPKKGLGNGIDWEAAEEKGFIHLVDFLPGISVKRKALKPQEDFVIKAMGKWISADIIFSHKKHAKWNGCEVCHPDIFPSVKKGDVKYTMFDIARGEYCGACHLNVAFPIAECQRCHVRRVNQQGR
jgi:c(7)-type cytochrome triheme protein